MAEETTFGCGEFLPGRGPFNFPDGPGDPVVNDPRGPNAEPGPDPGVYEPPEIEVCDCRPASVQVPIIIYLGSDGRYKYWEQQILKNCVPIVNGFPVDNTIDIITDLQTTLQQLGFQVTNTDPGGDECQSQTDPPGQDPDCESQVCDPIRIFYRKKIIRDLSGSPYDPSGRGDKPEETGPTYGIPECKCVVFTPGPSVDVLSQNATQTKYKYTWQRRCKNVKGGYTPAQEVLNNFVGSLTFDNFTVESAPPPRDVPCSTTSNGSTGLRCNSSFSCPDISLVITVRNTIPPTGPPAPTPQGPSTPGPTSRACRCVINSNDPLKQQVVDNENNVISVSAIFTQTCENIIGFNGKNNKQVVSNWRQGLIGTGARNFGGANVGKWGSDCAINNRCNGPCSDIVITYEIPLSTGIGDQAPIAPRPLNPDDPGNIADQIDTDPGVIPPGPPDGINAEPADPVPIPESPPGDVPPVPLDPNGTNSEPVDPVPVPEVSVGNVPPITLESQNVTYDAGGKDTADSIINSDIIDLSDPDIVRKILQSKPAGQEDEEVFFKFSSKRRKKVKNTSKKTDIFDRVIDESLLKLMTSNLVFGDWDSSLAASVTPEIIYDNLNTTAKNLFNSILNPDGTFLSKLDIYSMVGPRLLKGTISELKTSDLINLLAASKGDTEIKVVRSDSEIVNETVALALVEKNYFPLDYKKYEGLSRETFKNNKILSSDIDRYIDVTIADVTQRYYVNDDDTFIDRSTLKLKDGEYFDVTLGGNTTRVYAESEKDHAYFVPEKTRQVAINLLGGDPSRILSVSGDPSGIEIDHSLSSPRENVYFLSCVLSSVETSLPLNQSKHLKRTKARYEYTSLRNINEINEYIKYKSNHQTFILNDEDLLLDYVERDGKLFLEQTDIIVDSPKENKTIPLLTRQIPWYILLYPTNRSEYLPFDVKSQITDIDPPTKTSLGTITRKLITKPTITPRFKNSTNQFVQTSLVGKGARDVFDQATNDARINKINIDNPLFVTGYIDSTRKITSSNKFKPSRVKTGYRLLKEIIENLDQNYLLGLNGVGKTLTEFDVLSRFNLKQYNSLSKLDGFSNIRKTVFNGMFSDVKVVPATKNSDSKLASKKTQLIKRKSTATAPDAFPEQKSTNTGNSITPPTVEDPPTLTPYQPPAPPTALP
tara:strand:- start:1767 stop:5249 length:3483 start_codon:yes stop_codon:yes gene_type:complete